MHKYGNDDGKYVLWYLLQSSVNTFGTNNTVGYLLNPFFLILIARTYRLREPIAIELQEVGSDTHVAPPGRMLTNTAPHQ